MSVSAVHNLEVRKYRGFSDSYVVNNVFNSVAALFYRIDVSGVGKTACLTSVLIYGMRISIDDFGTGYSSLSYLKGLPIDTLKIDKSFIDTIVTDENTRVITESIVFMVKKLGFETVAEGVESKEQFEYLKDIGCNCIQGYLLGKPMPEEEIEKLLLRSM